MSIRLIIYEAGLTPHLLSKVDPETKLIYKKNYKKFKQYSGGSALVAFSATACYEVGRDIVNSKVKAYAYKSLFAIALGPFLQLVSFPLYVFTYGSKFRNIAIAVMEIGGKVTKGEMEIMSWTWVIIDLLVFGEYISATEGSNLNLLSNETDSKLLDVLESIGSAND